MRQATGWTSAIQFPAGAKDFSLLHSVQTASGTQPASSPVGTRGPFAGWKAAWIWNWPLTSKYGRGQEWWTYTITLTWRCTGRTLAFIYLFSGMNLSSPNSVEQNLFRKSCRLSSGLSVGKIAAGPWQQSHFRLRYLRDLWTKCFSLLVVCVFRSEGSSSTRREVSISV
jgi:hypothetical protein